MKEKITHKNIRMGSVVIWFALSIFVAGCATTPVPTEEELRQAALLAAEEAVRAGDAAVRRGDYEEALTHYLKAVGTEETADRWFRVGFACSALDRTERAIQAYLRVIELEPSHAGAHEAVGLEYLGLREDDRARTHLMRTVELEFERWRAHNGLGVLADRAQDYPSAIEHYEAALAANADSPMLMNNMGYSRYLAGDLDQAARDFYRATELKADYAPAWANLGLIYARRAWYSDALSILTRVRDEPVAYNDVGFIALRNGDLVEAEQLLSEAVRLSPAFYEAAYRNLEQARARLGRQSTATNLGADRTP